MHSKKVSYRGKTKSNINLDTDSLFKGKQISFTSEQSTVSGKGMNEKLNENTLDIETLLKTDLATLQRSKRTCVNTNTTYQCKICHLGFYNEYTLRRHLDYYGDPKYACKVCGTKFTDKRQLQTHIINAHENRWSKSTIKCVICNQIFLRSAYFRAHLSHYHQDYKELNNRIDDAERYRTKVKSVINTESSELVRGGSHCKEDLNKRIKTQYSKTDVHLETQHNAENNTLPAERVENVTRYPATVYGTRSRDCKCDGRSRKEEKAVSTLVLNADDVQNRPESNCERQAITAVDGHPICRNREQSRELKDNETKCTQILRENEQMLCLNGQTSLFLGPHVKDGSEDTKGDEKIVVVNMKKEILSQNVFVDVDESHESVTKDEKNITSERNKYEKPQTTLITHAEPDKSIDNGRAPSVPRNTVLNVDEVLLGNTGIDVPEEQDGKLGLSRSSFPRVKADNFHNIRVSVKSPVNIALLGARSDEKKTDEVQNFCKETVLRRLHSCKDCYVPLVRVKISGTSNSIVTADITQPEIEKLHTVIPSIVCDQLFSTKEMMLRHYRLQHFSYVNNELHCVCGQRMNGNAVLPFHFKRYCQKTISSATKPIDLGNACKPLEQKYACTGCDEKFWLESCLRSHVYNCKSIIIQEVKKIVSKRKNISTTSRKYSCAVCCSTFLSEKGLSKHEERYSCIATHQCVFCETMFPSERWLKCHMATAHTLTSKLGHIFECTICTQRFTTRRFERMHRMHIHEDQFFLEDAREPTANNLSPPDSDDPGDDDETSNKCNVCNTVFSNEKRYIDHTIYYMTSETIHCKTCGEKFEGQYRAHHHNKTVHYSEDARVAFTHHCNVCKEGFMYMTHLQAHMFHVHMSELKKFSKDKNGADVILKCDYACSVCDVTFSTPALLAAHESDFADDGEYLCNRCSKKCRTPSLLLDHLTLNHSNNAMQGGVKCRRCNENFLAHSAWVSHVKHVHSPMEPSEFYLEKNVAPTEKSGDTRYELIPTNESISSGVTYFKVKSSIDFCTIAATTYTNERADKISFVADATRINTVIPAEDKLVANSLKETEKTGFNIDQCRIKVENLEEEVLMMHDSDKLSQDESHPDTSPIAVYVPRGEESSKPIDEQDVNSKLYFDAGQIKVETKDNSNAGWNCNTCGYPSSGPADLARYMSLYSDRGRYMCETCGKRFEVRECYLGHKFKHIDHEKSAFICSTCNEGFETYQGLKMHITHLHSNMRSELPSGGGAIKVSGRKTRQSSFVKKSQPHVRTFSRKQNNQTATMPAHDDAPCPKKVEPTASPRLYTEIFEDEISMIYECPNCQEKYSSVKRLNEHLTAVHNINQDKNQPETCSQLPDAHVTCDICDKAFANKNILNTHRAKIHFIKSVQVVPGSTPVLEITVPNNRLNDPNNDQQSVVIGRLYKLEEINVDSKPVDGDENDITKKNSVSRIVGADNEQQKLLPKGVVKIKANAAIQLKPPVSNVQHLTSSAGTTENIESPPLIAVKRKLPIASAVHLKSPAATIVPLKPPVASAKRLKSLLSTDKPHKPQVATTVPLTSPVTTAVPLTSPAATALPLTSMVASTEKLESPTLTVIRLKPPIISAFRPKRPVANVAVKLKSVVTNAALLKPSVANFVQLNPSAVNTAQSIPLSDKQLILQRLNMGQVNLLKPQQQNNLNAEQHESPKSEENMTLCRSTPSDSENRNVLNRLIFSDSKLVTSSPSTIVKPEIMKIIEVESCSDLTSTTSSTSASTATSNMANTTDTKFYCQFACNICNIIFMNRHQLTEHEKTIHSLAISIDQVPDKSFTEANSTNNSMKQLMELVSSLPMQPETGNNTGDQISLSFDFESVLIPVSANDFDDYESQSPNNDELEGPVNEINPSSERVKTELSSDDYKSAPLKIQPFSKIIKNLRRNKRKRKDSKPTEMIATKRPKGVFDPVAYKELCKQHNLVLNMKSHNPKTS